MKLRMPTKLGYKNPKHIQVIRVTNRFPGGYWEDRVTTGLAAAEAAAGHSPAPGAFDMTKGNTMKKLFAMMMCSALMLGVAGANAADGMSKDAMKRTA